MEELHYPGAASTKKFLEERRERQQQAAMQQAMMQNIAAQNTQPQVPADVAGAIDAKAQQDAMQAAMGGMG